MKRYLYEQSVDHAARARHLRFRAHCVDDRHVPAQHLESWNNSFIHCPMIHFNVCFTDSMGEEHHIRRTARLSSLVVVVSCNWPSPKWKQTKLELNSFWIIFSVFWDLYCAAPERRDTCDHSSEAKAFHDYVSISLEVLFNYFPSTCIEARVTEWKCLGHGYFSTFLSKTWHVLCLLENQFIGSRVSFILLLEQTKFLVNLTIAIWNKMAFPWKCNPVDRYWCLDNVCLFAGLRQFRLRCQRHCTCE